MNKKLLIIIIITGSLLVLAVSGAAAWYFYSKSRSQDEARDIEDEQEEAMNCDHITISSDWQTYECTDGFGYTVMYPADWRVAVHGDEEEWHSGFMAQFSYNLEGGDHNSVFIGKRTPHTPESYKIVMSESEDPPYVFSENQDMIVDGRDAVRFTQYRTGEEEYIEDFYWIEYPILEFYRIIYGPAQESAGNTRCEQAVFQTMVGSFTFGQEYKEEDCQFSFRYPMSWEVESEEYYETAGGVKDKFPSIVLKDKSDDSTSEYISLNLRQTSCNLHTSVIPVEEYVNGNIVRTYTDPVLGVCLEADVLASDNEGNEAIRTFVTFSQEEDVHTILKQIVETFESY